MSTRCGVCYLTIRDLDSVRPSYLEDAQNPCVDPFPTIIAVSDGNWASSAWNVAGRKMTICQQRRQSLAETLDGEEILPVSKKERYRKVLISSYFPASPVMLSMWPSYRLRGIRQYLAIAATRQQCIAILQICHRRIACLSPLCISARHFSPSSYEKRGAALSH